MPPHLTLSSPSVTPSAAFPKAHLPEQDNPEKLSILPKFQQHQQTKFDPLWLTHFEAQAFLAKNWCQLATL